jgi:hypothetical protein
MRKLYEDMVTVVGVYEVVFEETLIVSGWRRGEWGDRTLIIMKEGRQDEILPPVPSRAEQVSRLKINFALLS